MAANHEKNSRINHVTTRSGRVDNLTSNRNPTKSGDRQYGVRDRHAILSIVETPMQAFSGKELYPTVFEKAGVYSRDIIMNYPFLDGNKRTGMTAASVFLEKNGYVVITKEGEIVDFALKVVHQKLVVKDIAKWFERHSKAI